MISNNFIVTGKEQFQLSNASYNLHFQGIKEQVYYLKHNSTCLKQVLRIPQGVCPLLCSQLRQCCPELLLGFHEEQNIRGAADIQLRQTFLDANEDACILMFKLKICQNQCTQLYFHFSASTVIHNVLVFVLIYLNVSIIISVWF